MGWLELGGKRVSVCERIGKIHVCICVCVTCGTFPNFTVIPLQPVIFVNEAPGLIVTIRIPTQRIFFKKKKKITFKEANYNFYTFRSKAEPCKTHAHVFMSACALFTRVNLSPAVIVWPNSIKACILLDWVTAFLQDEVGIPVQTLFPFFRHAHQTTIKFPILLVTVVWPSRETKIKRSSAE